MSELSIFLSQAIRNHRQGRLDEAERLYRSLLAIDPDHSNALHLLGVLEHQRKNDEVAVDLIRRAIQLNPDQAVFHNNLGVALKGLGRIEDAIRSYQKALALDPAYADAHSNLGLALYITRSIEAAQFHYNRALAINPDHVDALFNLANLLNEHGDHDRAIELHTRAIEKAPARSDIRNNLGAALAAANRFDDAIACYEQVIANDPSFFESRVNLASAWERLDRHDLAAHHLAEVVRLKPSEPLWKLRLAGLCPAVFPTAAEIARFRGRLEETLDTLPIGSLKWDDERLLLFCCHPSFNLAHHGGDDRSIRERYARLYCYVDHPNKIGAVDVDRLVTGQSDQINKLDRCGSSRIVSGWRSSPPRIGFVITHPHEGSFLRCVSGWLNRIRPGRFQLFIFGSMNGVPALERVIRHPDVAFIRFADRIRDAADRIRSTSCDLLYHWEVGTDAINFALPIARLAPVQCTSWGIQTTTGVAAIDHYLSSDWVEIAAADAHYTETLIRLPCLLSYQLRAPRRNPLADRSEFGIPDDVHFYACLQRPLKIHPDFDAILAGILRRDRRGLIVLLKGVTGHAGDLLAERFRSVMPDVSDRIAILPWLEPARYHRLLTLADVVLDPLHYGAGSSVYDVFSYDLPIVTLPGRFNASRYAQACYRKMGMLDLIASTADDYIEKAVKLATDRDARRSLVERIFASSDVLYEDDAVVREHERYFEWAIA